MIALPSLNQPTPLVPLQSLKEQRDPLGFSFDTASASLFVLKIEREGGKEEREQYRVADYHYRGFGTIDVLLCFQTQEMAAYQKEGGELIKQVDFDEALDLAKTEGVKAALIVERMGSHETLGRVVFVD